MKNPFEKNDHKVLITGIIIGSVAASAAAYLFISKSGASVRQKLAGHFNRLRDALIGGQPEHKMHTLVYLQHKAKKPKTDRGALLRHEIIGGEHSDKHDESIQL